MSDSPAPRGRIPLPRGTIVLVGLASAVVAAFGLSSIRGIVSPVLLTLVLVICAQSVRSRLERAGVPRGIGAGVQILLVLVILGGFGWALGFAFTQFALMLPQYGDQFQSMIDGAASWLQSIGIGTDQIQQLISGLNPSTVVDAAANLLGTALGLTGFLVIVFTMTILMSADATFAPVIIRQFDSGRPHLAEALRNYAKNVRRYMIMTSVLGIAQGVLNFIALSILGVPAALLWGILSFLCSFIPNIGYFFAIIPPLIFGYMVGGWPTVIIIVIVYGVINAGIQSIIQPKVIGNAVTLGQSLTFFSVLFWAVVLGPIGAILAIPLTLLIRTILIDANPDAGWLRPATGDTREMKSAQKAEDLERRAQRKTRPRRWRVRRTTKAPAPPVRTEGAPEEDRDV